MGTLSYMDANGVWQTTQDGSTGVELTDGIIETKYLADNAVTTIKILDNNVTDSKILSVSGSKVTGPLDGTIISAGTITADKLAEGSITSNYLDSSVSSTISSAYSIADSKNTVYYTPSKPVGSTYKIGDTWFDTDDGNHIYVYDGTDFKSAQDADIAAVHSLAMGKNTIYYSANEPTGSTYVEGDMWIDTANGNRLNVYNGSDWIIAQDEDVAAAKAAADAAVTSYVIEYAINNSETVAPVSGWSTTAPTRTAGTFIWTRTIVTYGSGSTSQTTPVLITGNTGLQGPQGIQGLDGADGSQGIQGPPGADGLTPYVHIAYATNSTGTTGFSTTDSVNKTYIGMYVDNIAADSSNPALYAWTLIKGADGAQGIPGPTGADGLTPYLHIAYATNATGTTGFSTTDGTNKTYIGQYVDNTPADSTNPALYTWSLIQGPQGPAGYTPVKGTDYFDGTDGQDGVSSYVWVRYGTSAAGAGMTTNPAGMTYIGIATTTTAVAPSTAGSYTWSLIKGDQGIQGETGANGLTSYLHIKYSDDGTTFTANGGETVGAYIGTYVDFTAADSTSFGAYTWNRVKGEQGPQGLQGLQGLQGTQGIQGPAGANGVSSYTHIAYSTSPTGATGFSTSVSTDKTYIGMYVDSNPIDSETPSSYAWTLIKGADGAQGIPGPAGADGLTPYLHIAYATDATGTTGFSTTDSVNKTYIGQYVDNTAADSTNPALYSWTLIKGADGTNAKLVSVLADTQVLTSPAAGGATTPATATVTGTTQNTTITAWTYSIDGAAFSATVPAGVSRTNNVVTITGQTMTAKTISVKMADASGIADTVTVAKVFNGADGTAASAGADAYTILLSNESHTFAGSISAALAGSTTSTVISYKGATAIASTVGTITGQVTGLTTAVTNNGTTAPLITITVTTALVTKSGTLTVPITVDGKSFTKTISWAVAYTGATGSTGAQGKGISSTAVTYQASTSGTTAPTGTWSATVPSVPADQYLWTRVVITYTDATTSTSYSVGKMGAQGPQGSTGATGAAGVGVQSTAVTYQAHTSGTTAPTGTWSATVPVVSPNQYLWTRIVITYTDASSSTAYSVGLMGAQGPQGAKGETGATGATGATGPQGPTGTSITGVTEYYLASALSSGVTTGTAGWTTTMQTITPTNKYLWNYEVISFSDSSTSPTIPVIIGTYGDTGATGRSLTAVTEYYLASASSSGVTRATAGWTTTMQSTSTSLPYLWNYEKMDWSSGTTPTYIEPIIIGVHGATGAQGSTGISVSSITPYYLQQASATPPTKPTLNPPGGSWVTTEPAYVANTYLFRTDRILYSNATFAYTDVSLVSSYTAASLAMTAANGKNKIYYQIAQPSGGTYLIGDLWFDTDNGNKPYIYNGSTWVANIDSSPGSPLAIANSKNQVYYIDTQPTGGVYLKGDLWFDTNDNYKQYVYTGSTWQLAQDAYAAQTLATTAMQTADGKNKIIYSTLDPSGTGFVVGDMWYKTGTNATTNQTGILTLYTYTKTGTNPDVFAWVSQTLTDSVVGNLTASKLTTGTLNANLIAANTMNGDRITANTIQASKLVTGTITAASGVIADAAITTAKIGDLQVTDAKIGSVSSTKITAAWIEAGAIKANSIDGTAIKTNTLTTNQVVGTFGTDLNISSNASVTVLARKDGLIGYINVSPEAITINANRININGALEISNWANTTDVTKIDGGKIYTGSITSDQIRAGSITAASGIIASINAGSITSGVLDVSRITISNFTPADIDGQIELNMLSTSVQTTIESVANKVDNSAFNTLASTVDNTEAVVNTITNAIGIASNVTNAIKIDAATGITIQQYENGTSKYAINLDGNSLDFIEAGFPVATIQGQMMEIPKAKVTSELQTGAHSISKSGEQTVFRWIG